MRTIKDTIKETEQAFKDSITRESFTGGAEAYVLLRFGGRYRYQDFLRIAQEKFPDLEVAEFDELMAEMK